MLDAYLALLAVGATIAVASPALVLMAACAGRSIVRAVLRGGRALALGGRAPIHAAYRPADFDHLPRELARLGVCTQRALDEVHHYMYRDSGGSQDDPNVWRREVNTADELWRWTIQAEKLAAHENSFVAQLGIRPVRVRQLLLESPSLKAVAGALAAELECVSSTLVGYQPTQYRGIRLHKSGPPTCEREEADTQLPSFETIETQYGPTLERMAGRFAGKGLEADDLLQEMKLAVWRSLPRYRAESSLRTYVLCVARNRAVSLVRRQRPAFQVEHQVRSDLDLEAALVTAERRAWLHAALSRLPEGVARAVRLRLGGATYRAIAESLGITVDNVGVRLHSGKARLSALVVKEGT